MFSLSILFGVSTIIFALFSMMSIDFLFKELNLPSLKVCSMFIIITIICGCTTEYFYNNYITEQHNVFINNVKNKNYQIQMTTIKGIYSNHIETNDGSFYLSKYSTIKNISSLKLKEDVKIYFIVDEDNNYQIININEIKDSNK